MEGHSNAQFTVLPAQIYTAHQLAVNLHELDQVRWRFAMLWSSGWRLYDINLFRIVFIQNTCIKKTLKLQIISHFSPIGWDKDMHIKYS